MEHSVEAQATSDQILHTEFMVHWQARTVTEGNVIGTPDEVEQTFGVFGYSHIGTATLPDTEDALRAFYIFRAEEPAPDLPLATRNTNGLEINLPGTIVIISGRDLSRLSSLSVLSSERVAEARQDSDFSITTATIAPHSNEKVVIGRSGRSIFNDVFQGSMASAMHCSIYFQGNELVVMDHSTNGTDITRMVNRADLDYPTADTPAIVDTEI